MAIEHDTVINTITAHSKPYLLKSVRGWEVIMAQYSENNNHYHIAMIIHYNNIVTNDLIFKQWITGGGGA